MAREPIIVILDLIADFMNLDEEHCYLYNQNWQIPRDKSICVVGSLGNTRVLANNKHYVHTSDGSLREQLVIRERQEITIDVFSYDLEALNRKEEILFALNTDKAQNTMEKSGFSCSEIPQSWTQLNEQDGDKILYRFTISFYIFCGRTWMDETDYMVGSDLRIIKDD
ncbi:hypothetical protein FACS1894152_1670 [Bacilli bacterium]|nr:hypothetical protein FACS1894152_1670 [Bacilli bacterium]